MSVVTTHPQVLTTAPSTSNAWLLASGSREGVSLDGSQPIERRRHGAPGDAPMDILTRLPALVVLERLPVPSLAMTRDGMILFANTAFAEMVGYLPDALEGLVFPDFF
ncbi:MAG TPA: PAS domain-containing protein, partial [Mycobacterium sp.]